MAFIKCKGWLMNVLHKFKNHNIKTKKGLNYELLLLFFFFSSYLSYLLTSFSSVAQNESGDQVLNVHFLNKMLWVNYWFLLCHYTGFSKNKKKQALAENLYCSPFICLRSCSGTLFPSPCKHAVSLQRQPWYRQNRRLREGCVLWYFALKRVPASIPSRRYF